MSNIRNTPVLYSYGPEGRDACWSALTISLNNFANRQNSNMQCVPRPPLTVRNICDSSQHGYKRNCGVNESKCRSVLRDTSPNYRSNYGTASKSASSSKNVSASKRRSEPIKTPPPQPQKQLPPPLERRMTARRFRSASTPRRALDVQSPVRVPVEARTPPAITCSSEEHSTPRKSHGPRQDVPLVNSQTLFSESGHNDCCDEDAKENGSAVPLAKPVADSAVAEPPAQEQTEICLEVTSSPATDNISLMECEPPVKTLAANPEVVVTDVDETVNYVDEMVITVEEPVFAVDVTMTTGEGKSVIDKTVSTVDKMATDVNMTAAYEGTVTAVEEIHVTATDVAVTALTETEIVTEGMITASEETAVIVTEAILTSSEETISAAAETVTASVETVIVTEDTVTATRQTASKMDDSPKFIPDLVLLTASPLLSAGLDDNDVNKGAEVLVVSNKVAVHKQEESVVVDKVLSKYEMRIKEIDENILSYSMSFLGALMFFVLFRIMF